MRTRILSSASAFILCGLCLSCSEAPLLQSDPNKRLNFPTAMVLVPNSTLALVVNSDINLNQEFGSLLAVDLSGRSLLMNTKIDQPTFSGRMAIDGTQNKLYIANKEKQAVLAYQYNVPGSAGQEISFTEVPVNSPSINVSHGFRADLSPYDLVLVPNTNRGPLLFTTNINSGSVSMADVTAFQSLDFNVPDANLVGLKLFSSTNFQNIKGTPPALGVYKMALAPAGRLLFVGSTRRNAIYVIDTFDQTIEAMIDLSFLPASTGVRGLVVSSSGVMYVAVPFLKQVIALDVRQITNNGIDQEVVKPVILGTMTVGVDTESVLLSDDELTLYVLNQGDPSLETYDVTSRFRKTRTMLTNLVSPSDMVINVSRNEIYILGYQTHNIAVLDLNTGAPLAEIK